MPKRQPQTPIQFIPAERLKTKYDVYGHFYSVVISRNNVVECRSVLEIADQSLVSDEPSSLCAHKPDAVFIMMNPGSSRPLVEVNSRISAHEVPELPISLVPTKPDTTQYQVMRLMHYCNWQHVRVLNLSDLRCSKSGEFFKQFKELEDVSSFDSHSIFSDKRTTELGLKMTSDKTIPTVVAWGVSDQLDPLIHRCTASLFKHKAIKGLLKEGTTNKFLHPLPSLQTQKVSWVERMVEHCRDK